MESITIEEARERHPDCDVIDVIGRADQDGFIRRAIYVWATEADAENDDGARATAVYWEE